MIDDRFAPGANRCASNTVLEARDSVSVTPIMLLDYLIFRIVRPNLKSARRLRNELIVLTFLMNDDRPEPVPPRNVDNSATLFLELSTYLNTDMMLFMVLMVCMVLMGSIDTKNMD